MNKELSKVVCPLLPQQNTEKVNNEKKSFLMLQNLQRRSRLNPVQLEKSTIEYCFFLASISTSSSISLEQKLLKLTKQLYLQQLCEPSEPWRLLFRFGGRIWKEAPSLHHSSVKQPVRSIWLAGLHWTNHSPLMQTDKRGKCTYPSCSDSRCRKQMYLMKHVWSADKQAR